MGDKPILEAMKTHLVGTCLINRPQYFSTYLQKINHNVILENMLWKGYSLTIIYDGRIIYDGGIFHPIAVDSIQQIKDLIK